jgi:hypothetical protein
VQTVARADVESGAVLLAGAQVREGMDRPTKITLAAGISLAACFALYLYLKARFQY